MKIEISPAGIGMGTWNHRVIKTKVGDEDYYQVHEVHYDTEGRVRGWTTDAIALGGDSLQDVKEILELMRQALNKPVLTISGNTLLLEEHTGLPARGTPVAEIPAEKRNKMQALASLIVDEVQHLNDESPPS